MWPQECLTFREAALRSSLQSLHIWVDFGTPPRGKKKQNFHTDGLRGVVKSPHFPTNFWEVEVACRFSMLLSSSSNRKLIRWITEDNYGMIVWAYFLSLSKQTFSDLSFSDGEPLKFTKKGRRWREQQESRPLVGKDTANSQNKRGQKNRLHLFAILNPALKEIIPGILHNLLVTIFLSMLFIFSTEMHPKTASRSKQFQFKFKLWMMKNET